MKALFTIFLSISVFIVSAQSDVISTSKGDLKIIPIVHGTLAMEWDGKTIYVDPYGGAEKFDGLNSPDLVLITDIHGDHLNANTLEGLDLDNSTLIAPAAVIEKLGDISFKKIVQLDNGNSTQWASAEIAAIPMYNLPDDETSRHKKGRGNGYVLNMGGKRVYISGDTEDIPEMRALKDIDVAFVCMNLPYTMDINQAASAVLEFQPKVVYPFHFRGGGGKFSDVEAFKGLVDAGKKDVEVRLRKWY